MNSYRLRRGQSFAKPAARGNPTGRGLRLLAGVILLSSLACWGQSLGNAGTIKGSVVDPSGAAVSGARVAVRNPVSGYSQQTTSGGDGSFQLSNLPPNPYHLEITAEGFAVFAEDVPIRNALPVQINATLNIAGSSTSVEVEAGGTDLIEVDPSAHTDVDRNQLQKIPSADPGGGLSQAITYSTGGVAADANGFFHPLGDHAQVSFVIDGQPISDQQSKVFSTQLPVSAVQSMELDTGSSNAEFGDKTSLVAQITTRSGLGAKHVFGNVDSSYGSFGTATGSIGLGFGDDKAGNFLAIDGSRSGRFLDTPEFRPMHDAGNNQTVFDRADYQLTPRDILHLNLFAARNWIQIPNSLDQLGQDQRQKVVTWSIAPGYQHIFNASALLTIHPYVRKDQFEYFPSKNVFADTPLTNGQNRHLFNYGVKSDVSLQKHHQTMKLGIDLKQTRLFEEFNLGITDPAFNAICLDGSGHPAGPPTLLDSTGCGGLGFTANPGLRPGLIPFDLTRGGTQFRFRDRHNINQYAVYVQDGITAGNFAVNLGLRGDLYRGLVSAGGLQPRGGVAYNLKKTGTVLRAAYSRTFETPFNENLLLSNATGSGGLAQNVFGAGGVSALRPGRRNQYNVGFQQSIGRWVIIDADYFWKYTRNAYDFSTLLNSTITFPIAWNRSKLDGFTGRVSSTTVHGFQAYWTFGHTRARYFPPESGGLISVQPAGPFRIDHDQVLQSTVNLRYQRPKNAEWIDLSWRYDSGLVVSGVPDVAAALGLTAAQQTAIGFSCDGNFATLSTAITACNGVGRSNLLTLPQSGTEDDDHHPDRVKPRNVFDIGIGTDNLFHAEGHKRWVASVQIANLTNKIAVYNFLSTFSGTHFLQPRSVAGRVGFTF